MERILIIGSPGSGKSTLAHVLADRTGLPLHHLDRLYWGHGWVSRDEEDWLADLRAVLRGDRWIIDGNYGSTLPERLERADAVIWLDYRTGLCLRRVLQRWWRYRGNTRPDMSDDCPERLDLEFLRYVWTFRRNWRVRNAAALTRFPGESIRLRTPAEAAAWVAGL